MLKGDKDLVQGVGRWGGGGMEGAFSKSCANRSAKIRWWNMSVREKESNNSAEFLNLCELKWF